MHIIYKQQTLADTNRHSESERASERERERERECFESKRAAQRTFSTNVVAMAAAYCFNYRIHFFPEVILLPNSRRRNKRSNFSLEKKRQEGGKKKQGHTSLGRTKTNSSNQHTRGREMR
jgi:hypothetical protein